MHSFYSVLIKGAVILDGEHEVVQVLPTFWPAIPTLGGIYGDVEVHQLGKFEFWGLMECTFSLMSKDLNPQNVSPC